MTINLRLVAFFFAVYFLALIAMIPLSWLRHFFDPALQAAGIRVEQLDGSLWSGEARLQAPHIPSLQLDWQAQPLYLLTLRLPYQWQLSNTALELTGRVTVKPSGVRLDDVSGYIDDVAFADIASTYGADIQGRLRLSDVDVSASWRAQPGDLDGEFSWSGGAVSVPFGSRREQFEVPQMQGLLASDDNGWQADIRAMDNTSLINARLSQEGLGSLSVKRALAERLNLPIPAGRETLFEISQQVL
ncbi:hypothetical protein BGP77_02965 [Saccharospirillum sp. MSK14-1]|uniref:type II secretion system protein N n=1 Tax=Saccharospirillum sp. MSK14-1 TaxID=1897632 RepID=UPI000D3AF99D|nr:type II secretion system protein N [Saccharospirillum sp. MSK14-1]PTY36288.1 hypothetical protein BGP77_02965 [Saccharospirillum sp. MSK14-1]